MCGTWGFGERGPQPLPGRIQGSSLNKRAFPHWAAALPVILPRRTRGSGPRLCAGAHSPAGLSHGTLPRTHRQAQRRPAGLKSEGSPRLRSVLASPRSRPRSVTSSAACRADGSHRGHQYSHTPGTGRTCSLFHLGLRSCSHQGPEPPPLQTHRPLTPVKGGG